MHGENAPPYTEHILHRDGEWPNNERMPAIHYRDAAPGEPEAFEQLFMENGWPASWRNSIFSYHHYHSTAYEVLGIYRGRAQVQLGGPRGRTIQLHAGDAIMIPPGVSHKNLESTADFGVVGAYPRAQNYDMNYGKPEERERAEKAIPNVPFPSKDPVMGDTGPLMEHG